MKDDKLYRLYICCKLCKTWSVAMMMAPDCIAVLAGSELRWPATARDNKVEVNEVSWSVREDDVACTLDH